MSKVESYVFCEDGMGGAWYAGLIYGWHTGDWFIVFDDEDPVEIVIRKGCGLDAGEILEEVGYVSDRITPDNFGEERLFDGGFADAESYWLDAHQDRFPEPLYGRDCWDEVFDVLDLSVTRNETSPTQRRSRRQRCTRA